MTILFAAWVAVCLVGTAASLQDPNENAPLDFSPTGRDGGIQLLPGLPTPDEVDSGPPPSSVGTTLENYPSPFTHPAACNRGDLEVSRICDPDRVLSKADADRIEELLRDGRSFTHTCGELGEVPYSFAVALIRRLPIGVDPVVFATELLDRWALGHEECHDGVIMLISKEDNSMVLRWKRGVEQVLNYRLYNSLQSEFKEDLKKRPLRQAVVKSIEMVEEHLSGEIQPARQTPQLVVLLTLATIVGFTYCACIVTVLADQTAEVEAQLRHIENQFQMKVEQQREVDDLELDKTR